MYRIHHHGKDHLRRMLAWTVLILTVTVMTGMLDFAFGGDKGGGSSGITVSVVTVNLETETEVTLIKIEEDNVVYDKTLATAFDGSAYRATFTDIPPGGTCYISGSDVPGFETPIPEQLDVTRIKGAFEYEVLLKYLPAPISVTGIEMTPLALDLMISETAMIDAHVLPLNASQQTLVWSVSDPSIISLNNGMVTGLLPGTASVTAESLDGGFTQTCLIDIWEVLSLVSPAPISANTGETIVLPPVCEAVLTNGTETLGRDVAIEWIGANELNGVPIIVYDAPGSYVLTGLCPGSTETIELNIEILGDPIITSPDSLILSASQLSVFYGIPENVQPLSISCVQPEDSDLSTLVWTVQDETIARLIKIDDAHYLVEGLSAGTTYVVVETWDAEFLASCLISVALDPELTDAAYIEATTDESPEPVDQFESKDKVFIRCYNLTPGTYHIKVEDKGRDNLLLEGDPTDPDFEYPTVIIPDNLPDGKTMYNLYNATHFLLTENYSMSYFVSMSKDVDFPAGDDESGLPRTYVDNFKIGSPVPTTLLDAIHINVMEYDVTSQTYHVPPEFIGRDVILAREIDKPVESVVYEDYLTGSDDPLYNDEVKLIGKVLSDGSVSWLEPKEKLKIGGYFLLIEIPLSNEEPLFATNLDLVNPESEDGALLKELHLTRDDLIFRDIIVTRLEP